jgi:hypothetical protein
MIKTRSELLAEIAALPDPITRTSLTALLTNIVDSGAQLTTGIPYGRELLFKANGNTNREAIQDNDITLGMSAEGVLENTLK